MNSYKDVIAKGKGRGGGHRPTQNIKGERNCVLHYFLFVFVFVGQEMSEMALVASKKTSTGH